MDSEMLAFLIGHYESSAWCIRRCMYCTSLVPSRIALMRGKICLVTLGTEIGARTTHGMWNCAEIIMIAK